MFIERTIKTWLLMEFMNKIHSVTFISLYSIDIRNSNICLRLNTHFTELLGHHFRYDILNS